MNPLMNISRNIQGWLEMAPHQNRACRYDLEELATLPVAPTSPLAFFFVAREHYTELGSDPPWTELWLVTILICVLPTYSKYVNSIVPQLQLIQPICYEGTREQYRYKLDARDWEDVLLADTTTGPDLTPAERPPYREYTVDWQDVSNDRFDRNSQKILEDEVAQKRIMRIARQSHPDASNSFDPQREQRDREEEAGWRRDAERRFGIQHPHQQPSRSCGRNCDGGYYGSRQRAQSGHVRGTRMTT